MHEAGAAPDAPAGCLPAEPAAALTGAPPAQSPRQPSHDGGVDDGRRGGHRGDGQRVHGQSFRCGWCPTSTRTARCSCSFRSVVSGPSTRPLPRGRADGRGHRRLPAGEPAGRGLGRQDETAARDGSSSTAPEIPAGVASTAIANATARATTTVPSGPSTRVTVTSRTAEDQPMTG